MFNHKDMEMDNNDLQAALAQFAGTAHYYRLNRLCVITDGAKYLAEAAGAFWLLDTAARAT